jgi:transcriptional regulator with XRE-family HTH domain
MTARHPRQPLADAILDRRLQLGLTQAGFARQARVSRSYYKDIESGKQLSVSPLVLTKLAQHLGCSIDDISVEPGQHASRGAA